MKVKQNRENNYMEKRRDLPLTCSSFPFNINTWLVPAKQKKKHKRNRNHGPSKTGKIVGF